MGLTIFHIIFHDIPHIQSEGGECPGILCGILSFPVNTEHYRSEQCYEVTMLVILKKLVHLNFYLERLCDTR